MRNLLLAAAAGATLAAGALATQPASAQAYVYYPPTVVAPVVQPGYRYDDEGRPYYDDGYRPAAVVVGEAGSALGPTLVQGYAAVPHDRYGPDPNRMGAPHGHP